MRKKLIKLGLGQKIAVLVVILIIVAVSVSVSISGQWYIDRMYENIELNALNIVTVTAKSPIIINGLEQELQDGSIQSFVQDIQNSLEQVDIMVVADANGVRYGHTKSDRVGLMFSAQDHAEALEKGHTYVSIGPGTLGESLRAFTPVWSKDKKVLGFVMAGTLLDSISQAKAHIVRMILLFILLGGGIGAFGAFWMGRYIKKSLLGYEPEDIARLYLENQSILAAVHEGVIAIDQQRRITLINDAARRYSGINGECIGTELTSILPLSKLPCVLETGEPLLDVPYAMGDIMTVSNNVPIMSKSGEIIGGVCTFRDQTEVKRLAEHITGVEKIVDALRASTHEFKNKLHVILGLMESGEIDQAKEYIGATSDEMQSVISQTLNHISQPTVSALLIGKSRRARELDIQWELSDESDFSNCLNFDVNSLVVIIGNLIDNAFEALDASDCENKKVEVLLTDEEGPLILTVKDNGPGVSQPDKIFEKGFTTKSESRGYGLYLVKEQIDKYQGVINVENAPDGGALFSVYMDKEGIL